MYKKMLVLVGIRIPTFCSMYKKITLLVGIYVPTFFAMYIKVKTPDPFDPAFFFDQIV